MNEEIKMTHLYTSEEKLSWWDYGEWVEEPDIVNFVHQGMKCRIIRVVIQEPCGKKINMFGGYLNGYTCIPKDHPCYGKDYDEIDIEIHGGLTFGEYDADCGLHWIGFDSSHSGDYVPSLEKMKATAPWMDSFRKNVEMTKHKFNLHDSPIFQRNYRNVHYCIDECKSMAEQLHSIYNI